MIKTSNELMEKEINKTVSENVINTEDNTEEIDYDAVCPVCNEHLFLPPKKLFNRVHRFRVMCKCERDEEEKQKQEKALYEHKKRVKELKLDCFEFKSSQNCTFENDNGLNPKMDVAKKYVEKWNSLENAQGGLLLIGKVGTGKTYMAAAIANGLLEQEVTVKMTDFISIGNDIFNASDKNAVVKKLVGYDLLIIDDLGVERKTEFSLEYIFKVIDERVNSGKPMIVTTNLNIDTMNTDNDQMLKRIYDRICSVCLAVDVDGPNIREIKTMTQIETVSNTLNG